MGREFSAALLAVIYLGALVLTAAVAFRFIVPSILEAHFYGSVLAASAAGLGFVALLALLAASMTRHVIRLLGPVASPDDATQSSAKEAPEQ